MSVNVREFGKMKDGRTINLYTIENNGISADVTNVGAILVALRVPNKAGEVKDIVMGFDKAEDYFANPSFFGATIGRSANRIANAAFTIDGVTYQLKVNDNENNLHSDMDEGFHKQYWDAEIGENSVKFSYLAKDMETGFPGNLNISVTYSLSDKGELKLKYEGKCDKKTLINLTNHTYFNLCGHDFGDISDTELTINASKYTSIVPGAIPTGEYADVKGTPMDFTVAKKIGKEIDTDWDQLTMVGGYDHNFALDDYTGKMRKVAEAKADGRIMSVFTDLPGVQFYAGNCIAPQIGKGGAKYDRRGAFCLETQYFPNSVNQEGFVKPVFDAGQSYETETIYQFTRE